MLKNYFRLLFRNFLKRKVYSAINLLGLATGIAVLSGTKHFEEKHVVFADSNFFEIFQGQAVAGDPKTAMHSANTLVLNESTAIKYFGSAEKAIGQTLNFEGNKDYKVQGVVKDWPEKAHLQWDLLCSTLNFGDINEPNFYDLNYFTYLVLKDHADAKALEAKLPEK